MRAELWFGSFYSLTIWHLRGKRVGNSRVSRLRGGKSSRGFRWSWDAQIARIKGLFRLKCVARRTPCSMHPVSGRKGWRIEWWVVSRVKHLVECQCAPRLLSMRATAQKNFRFLRKCISFPYELRFRRVLYPHVAIDEIYSFHLDSVG